MQRSDKLALIVIGLIVLGLPAFVLGYQYVLRPLAAGPRVIDIRAATPENGGFQPDSIRVMAGEVVTLRFYSVDVTHGIAIGPGLGIDLGQLDPGHVAEVTVIFPQAGTYTLYCNTWCSDNHWRMRGVIEVRDPTHPDALPTAHPDPVIEALIAEGVDIDAAHGESDSTSHLGDLRLSASQGRLLAAKLVIPPDLGDPMWRFSHTPAQGLARLVGANPQVSEADLGDVIAYLWMQGTRAETLAAAEVLYNKNCAACHGQYGGGDGPAADTTTEPPVAFTDLAHMLERRGDVLYAKIRRGGMGTGMPNFGTLFTEEETRALVDYLWVLAFQERPEY